MAYLFNLSIILICFILKIISQEPESSVVEIVPDKKYELRGVKLNEERLYSIKVDLFKKQQIYKVLVHFIGPLGIDIKTKLICNDFYDLKKERKNIRLNDYSEFDFRTNDKGIPALCGENYNNDKVLVSITPYSLTYQFRDESDIKFNAILEVNTNIINLSHQSFSILVFRKLYRIIFFVLFGIPIVLCFIKGRVRQGLTWIINEKLDKQN